MDHVDNMKQILSWTHDWLWQTDYWRLQMIVFGIMELNVNDNDNDNDKRQLVWTYLLMHHAW